MQTASPPLAALEWPTYWVIFLVHGAWLTLLAQYHVLGPALAAPLLTLTLTWHSSMCHEILHGHPTRLIWVNDLFAQLPLALMVPYFTFKESHLKHHQNHDITLPGADPESFFIGAAAWREKGAIMRAMAWVNMTFAGRILLGPGIAFGRLIRQIAREIGGEFSQQGGRGWSRTARYLLHFTLAGGLIIFAERYFAIAVWHYLLSAYLSHSLLLVRSFFEHRPHPEVAKRTVIVESGLALQVLFLNNNFHAVHHRHPRMPWCQLKAEYQRNRAHYLVDNGHFRRRGYRDWLRYLFKPVAPPTHPFSAP